MLPLARKFKLNASILSIGSTGGSGGSGSGSSGESVVLIDSAYHAYELKNGEFVFAKKIAEAEPLHAFSKAAAVSMNGFIAFGRPKSNVCEVLRLENGQLTPKASLEWHKADIYNIRFSRDGRFLVTGGEDGRVLVFRLSDFHLAHILPPRPDYISNVHFGKISRLIVYSSYDLQNCIFDMDQNAVVAQFATNAVIEDMSFFEGDKKIFFVCQNGESGVFDIENKALNLKPNYDFWLTRTGLTKDDNYAYIGARKKLLSYLRLDSNAPSFSLPLEFDVGISAMRVIAANLYVGFANGNLLVFDLKRFEEELGSAIAAGDFKLAKETSDKNYSLKTLKTYDEFMQKCFAAEFGKVKALLEKDASEANLKAANEALAIFFEDSSKKAAFANFVANLGIFAEFKAAVESGDYAKAYKIAEENPAIKATLEFENLENLYNEAFNKTKALLLAGNQEAANAAIKPFVNAPSKKEVVSTLLRNAAKFAQADALFKNKQYADFFKLAESLPALKNTPNYQKMFAFGEQICATINELEAKQNYAKALELLEILARFAPFAKAAGKIKNDIALRVEFLELFKKRDYTAIYQNIQKYRPLRGQAEYIELGNILAALFDDALSLALNGRTEPAHRMLEPYFEVAFFKEKIKGIFNLIYLDELEKEIAKKNAPAGEAGESAGETSGGDGAESKAAGDSPLKAAGAADSPPKTAANPATNAANPAAANAKKPPKKEAKKIIDWKRTLENYAEFFGKNDELQKVCAKDAGLKAILDKLDVAPKDRAFEDSVIVFE